MPNEHFSMRKAKEVLRRKWGHGPSGRAIATSCSIGVATVQDCLRRARLAGLAWPLPDGLSDDEIATSLYSGQRSGRPKDYRRSEESRCKISETKRQEADVQPEK